MSPSSALMRWLAQLNWKHIRRIERLQPKVVRDDKRPLRGVLLADDLCMTRERAFYKISANGKRANPISFDDVAHQYDLGELQAVYRSMQDRWKQAHRRPA